MTANKPAKKCATRSGGLFGLFSRLRRSVVALSLLVVFLIPRKTMLNMRRFDGKRATKSTRLPQAPTQSRGSHRENKTGQTFLFCFVNVINLSFN